MKQYLLVGIIIFALSLFGVYQYKKDEKQNAALLEIGSASRTVTAAATDLTCTDCLNATEIEDIYLLNNADDSTTGLLTIGGGFISQAASSTNSGTLDITGTATFGANLVPLTTDGSSLGTTALNFSDLFIDLGGVINFDSGDVTLTHSAGDLALGGGNLTIAGGVVITPDTTVGTGATLDMDWNVSTKFATSTNSNKTITFSNVNVGETVMLLLTNDSGSALTLTYPASVNFGDSGEPTLDAINGGTDIITFTASGTSTETVNGRFAD